MTWYSLGLAGGLEDFSEDAWRLAWEISQAETGPDDSSAIFKKPGPDHRLTLYFTPSSRLIAETFGAMRCEKPSPAGMSLVAGPENAWQIHFGRVFGLRRRIGALQLLARAARALPASVRDRHKRPASP